MQFWSVGHAARGTRPERRASWKLAAPAADFERPVRRSSRRTGAYMDKKLTAAARREPFDSAQDRFGPSRIESIIFVEDTAFLP